MKELDKLSAPLEFKAIMVAVIIITFISIFAFDLQAYAFPLIVFVSILAVSQLQDYYLADQFIKKRKERIIHRDIKEVRKLLWWWIVTDDYGDSMWINYTSLEKESKRKLADWLRPRTNPKSEPNVVDNA